MSNPLKIGHFPTDRAYATDNYFVLLMETCQLETTDTNLVTICEAGLYNFSTKQAAKDFTNACNSTTTEPIARALARYSNQTGENQND